MERCPQCDSGSPQRRLCCCADITHPLNLDCPTRCDSPWHGTAPDAQFWKYHHDLLQRELKIARDLLEKCAGAMECLPCTPTYIKLAKEARELLARVAPRAPAAPETPPRIDPYCPDCGSEFACNCEEKLDVD
jgi:hypothetical protein